MPIFDKAADRIRKNEEKHSNGPKQCRTISKSIWIKEPNKDYPTNKLKYTVTPQTENGFRLDRKEQAFKGL